MPLVPMLGISKGKPCAILITVSEKRYKEYEMNKVKIAMPISVELLIRFLDDNEISYRKGPESTFGYATDPPTIYIWESAEFLDLPDIKEALIATKNDYGGFLNRYIDDLKKV